MRRNPTHRVIEWPLVALHCATVTDTPGQRIKKARQLRGLTQEDLAEATGVSTRTIGRIEKDERDEPRHIGRVKAFLGLAAEPDDEPSGEQTRPDPEPHRTASRSDVVAWALDEATDMEFIAALARRLSRSASTPAQLPGEALSFRTADSPDGAEEPRQGSATGRET
jgi:transcriptional regulator with XRE-family HTH domain